MRATGSGFHHIFLSSHISVKGFTSFHFPTCCLVYFLPSIMYNIAQDEHVAPAGPLSRVEDKPCIADGHAAIGASIVDV